MRQTVLLAAIGTTAALGCSTAMIASKPMAIKAPRLVWGIERADVEEMIGAPVRVEDRTAFYRFEDGWSEAAKRSRTAATTGLGFATLGASEVVNVPAVGMSNDSLLYEAGGDIQRG